MKTFTPVYIPAAVGTFHMETASAVFASSVSLLKSLCPDCICPEDKLLSAEAIAEFLEGLSPDLVIFQNLTFANGAYISEVLRRYSGPLVLWTVRDPAPDGGRLKLNALTGAFSAAHTAMNFGDRRYSFVYGGPDEPAARKSLEDLIKAAEVVFRMRHLRIAAVGHTPQGFGFGRALDSELMRCFGAELIAVEARELIEKAKGYTDMSDEAAADSAAEGGTQAYLKKTEEMTAGFEKTPAKNRLDHAKLYRAYSEFIKENNIGAIASRCWPDFFTSYGTPVCTVLSLLGAEGVPCACEADVYGALSMWIGTALSGEAAYFGDPVTLDETENTVTFWHCGAGAVCLARKDTGAAVGVHPNRRIGPAMDFGLEGGFPATIFRIGRKPDGTFRFFTAEGEILDRPKQYTGTSVVVRTDENCLELIKKSVEKGYEPHFAVIRGRHAAALAAIAGMLGAEGRGF